MDSIFETIEREACIPIANDEDQIREYATAEPEEITVIGMMIKGEAARIVDFEILLIDKLHRTQTALEVLDDAASEIAVERVINLVSSFNLTGDNEWEVPSIDSSIHGGIDLYWRRGNKHITVFIPGESDDMPHIYRVEADQESVMEEHDLEIIPNRAAFLLKNWLGGA